MNEADAMDLIRETRSLVFTTREFYALAGISMTFASQMLRRLAAKGRIARIYQGVWADVHNNEFNAYKAVPFLTRPHPAAVSLLTALHLHGMIEQIPQVIYVVSTARTRKIKTPIGNYSIHQIAPDFFDGYEEYRGEGGFLIATPEKALVDCLYLSSRRGKRFLSLPELSFPKGFSKKRAEEWAGRISFDRIRLTVTDRLRSILSA